MNEEDSNRHRFQRDDQTKEARLENVRRRLQASTPATRRVFRLPPEWRRPLAVGVVMLILLWVLWR